MAIDVEVRVTPLTSAWGTDSAANMQAAIIAYAAQGALGLGIDQGFEEFGFPPGADIVISQLYTPVNSIPGAKVVSIKIALHGDTLGVLDLSVDWNQIGQFTTANISIVEVT